MPNNVAVDTKQAEGIYQKVQKWLMPDRERTEPETVLVLSDTNTPQEMFAKIQTFGMGYWAQLETQLASSKEKRQEPWTPGDIHAAVAAMGVDEQEDLDSYVIDPRYNDQQLTILEDCYVSDPVINTSINKTVFGTVGPHGKTVLDTKKEFNIEQDRRKYIQTIVGIAKYVQAKSDVDNLFMEEQISFYTNLQDFLINWLVYGRAAWFVLVDNSINPKQKQTTAPITDNSNKAVDVLSQSELGDAMNLSKPWKGLILLDSRRLGRVKVNKETLRVTHVEYYDVEVNNETSEYRPAVVTNVSEGGNTEIKPAWLEVGKDIIYWTHSSGAAGRNTQYVGYSKIESIVHISQVKRIILNKNTKEAAEVAYMGVGRVQFDPNTPDSLIINFIENMKRAMGKWFGHKIPVTVTVDKMTIDLEKFAPLVDLINREILRCIGLASFLVGYEQIANYANSEQIMLATNQFDIRPLRSRVKDFIQMKVLDPLFVYYLSNPVNSPVEDSTITEPEPEIEKPEPTITKDDEGNNENDKPAKKEKPIKIEDKDVKLTYEMEDVNFSTKEELAKFYSAVNAMVPLPVEAILRGTGLDNWVEEVQAEAEKKEQAAKEAMEKFEKDPFTAQAATQQKNKFSNYSKAAVGAGDPMHTDDPEIKAAILATETMKQNLFKAIAKKYA